MEVDVVKTCSKCHVSKVNFYVLKATATEWSRCSIQRDIPTRELMTQLGMSDTQQITY